MEDILKLNDEIIRNVIIWLNEWRGKEKVKYVFKM